MQKIATYYRNKLGTSKMFRVYHFNGNYEDRFKFFGETNSPKFIWDVGGSTTYGVRNSMSFYARGPNHKNGDIEGLPHQLNGEGDMSASYKTELSGMRIDGSDAHLPNKVEGGLITYQSQPAALDHVFGTEGVWTKVAFYVRMNSAPGVQDGVVMQWIDDQRIFFNDHIDWVRSDYDMVKWNAVAFSGNDFFRGYPNEDKHEEWYAIDDLYIADSLPVETDAVNFNLYAPELFGENQPPSRNSEVKTTDYSIEMSGNIWQKINLPYEVTKDTVIEFDFASESEGENHAISFETDNVNSRETSFKVFGSQNWGISRYQYNEVAGTVQHFIIPAGNFFTGKFKYLVFINDDDQNAQAHSIFSNIKIYEKTSSAKQ